MEVCYNKLKERLVIFRTQGMIPAGTVVRQYEDLT